ncbi:MAG: hypothetical protein JW786_06770 [Desulfobacterales bacterium]|nr:hypothetical protein [Desulfobacterales bacterium]
MVEEKNGSITIEVEQRLDELFGDSDNSSFDHSSHHPEFEDCSEALPFRELKSAVLSIDWEITDDAINRFIKQLNEIKSGYSKNKIIINMIQILNSLAVYLKINKGRAHPNTMKVLKSVFSGLEKVALSKKLSESEKKKTLFVEVEKFKELKQQIIALKADKAKKTEAKPTEETKSKVKETQETHSDSTIHMISEKAYRSALEDIKKFIKVEFDKLRKELNMHSS